MHCFQTFQAFHRDNTTAHCQLARQAHIRHLAHFSRATGKFHRQDSFQSLPRGTIRHYPRNNQCLKNIKSLYTFQHTKTVEESNFLPGVPCKRCFHFMPATHHGHYKKLKMAAFRVKSGAGTQRLLQKLNKSIEDGEYYEAHQLIRTLYFRFVFFCAVICYC